MAPKSIVTFQSFSGETECPWNQHMHIKNENNPYTTEPHILHEEMTCISFEI